MATLLESRPTLTVTRKATVYAITFDLDTKALEQHYGVPYNGAYAELRKILNEEHFSWTQGSVYFGDTAYINAVTCVLAARRLAVELPWFPQCVRDIRMLRIEENNDLTPAINTP